MAESRIEWKPGAFYELRRAAGVRRDLEARGRAVLEACGGEAAGYVMTSEQGSRDPQGRWQVSVIAATEEARIDNGRHNTLVRNFGAARG
jgi:hypothetical protein